MNLRTLIPAAAFLFAGCSDSTGSNGPPAGMLAVGNADIAVTVGSTAIDSITARVVDADGRAVPNAQVVWSVDAPGGVTVSPTSGTTNAQGIVRTSVQAGTTVGTRIVRAAIAGSTPTISLPFTVNLTAGPAVFLQGPTSLVLASGTAGMLSLTAVDAFGNPASLTGITWTSSHPNIASVTAGLVTSQALGTSTVTAQIGAASTQIPVRVVPPTLRACETNTATLCADWSFSSGRYTATWAQGSQAVIRVERFDADSVRFAREDPAGTSSGLTAVYRGRRLVSGVQNGVVTWTEDDFSFSGVWSATW